MSKRPIWRGNPQTDAFVKNVFESTKGILDLSSIFNVYNDPQLWYDIPGFNGYEMSDYGLVRSMKHFQRYPFGMLIRFDDKENYILSNSYNNRLRIPRKDLWDLVVNNPNPTIGYPRTTNQTDHYSRNRRMFLSDLDSPMYGPGSKGKEWELMKKHVQTNKQEPTFFPQFTVVPDDKIELKDAIDVLEFRTQMEQEYIKYKERKDGYQNA